jgi:hypothetical protein
LSINKRLTMKLLLNTLLFITLFASPCFATLSASYAPDQYNTNGTNTTFTASWGFFAKSDLVVTHTDSSDIDTVLELGSGAGKYTVYAANADYSSGATITTGTAYPSGDRLTIERLVPYGQQLSINGDFVPAKPLETQLDKLAAQNQQILNDFTTTISFPDTDLPTLTYAVTNSATARAGQAIGFDTSGNVTTFNIADEGGAFTAVDTATGLSATGGTISGKVDNDTLAFSGGNFAIKAGGVGATEIEASSIATTKLASPTGADTSVVTGTAGANGQLAGWNADGDAVDSGFDVTNSDSLGTSDTTLPTQGNVKAYVDTYAMKYSGATEHSSAMPTAGYTDLDLSSTVGVNRAFVHLSVEPDVDCELMFVPNGVAKDVGYTAGASKAGAGASAATCTAGNIVYLSLITDASGVVDWKSTVAGTTTTVKVLAYQVLQ